MPIRYGVYDKSLRESRSRYLLFFDTATQDVALACYRQINRDARYESADEVPLGALFGGLIATADGWACVFRYVAAKDTSPDARPLNVILMALVRRDELRGKDWRSILAGGVFSELASRLRVGNREPPPDWGSAQVLPEVEPSQAVLCRLAGARETSGFSENQLVAAVTALPADEAFTMLITDVGGHRRFQLHFSTPVPQPQLRHTLIETHDSEDASNDEPARVRSETGIRWLWRSVLKQITPLVANATSRVPPLAGSAWTRVQRLALIVLTMAVGVLLGKLWWLNSSLERRMSEVERELERLQQTTVVRNKPESSEARVFPNVFRRTGDSPSGSQGTP